MIGGAEPDPDAAQWLIRIVLALWYWPVKNPDAELQMLHRFLTPLFI